MNPPCRSSERALCARTPTRRAGGQESSQGIFQSATFAGKLRASMGIRGRLGESWRAFAQAFRSPTLRRLQLAGVGSTLAVWANSIAIAVYAYNADGAKAVGIVLFA